MDKSKNYANIIAKVIEMGAISSKTVVADEQCISWVTGQLLLSNPDMTREQALAYATAAVKKRNVISNTTTETDKDKA